MFQHTAGSFNILHLFIFHSCQQLEKCRTILSLSHKTFVLYQFRATYHAPCCTNYYDTSNSLIYICFKGLQHIVMIKFCNSFSHHDRNSLLYIPSYVPCTIVRTLWGPKYELVRRKPVNYTLGYQREGIHLDLMVP